MGLGKHGYEVLFGSGGALSGPLVPNLTQGLEDKIFESDNKETIITSYCFVFPLR